MLLSWRRGQEERNECERRPCNQIGRVVYNEGPHNGVIARAQRTQGPTSRACHLQACTVLPLAGLHPSTQERVQSLMTRQIGQSESFSISSQLSISLSLSAQGSMLSHSGLLASGCAPRACIRRPASLISSLAPLGFSFRAFSLNHAVDMLNRSSSEL